AIWERFQKVATFETPQDVNGHRCAVVEFKPEPVKVLTHVEVCAATDLDYYPIRVTSESGDGPRYRRGIIEVVDIADFKTSKGRVIVPLKIKTVIVDDQGTELSTEISTIEKESLRVNEPIAEERFYLRRFAPLNVLYAANVSQEQRSRYERGPK